MRQERAPASSSNHDYIPVDEDINLARTHILHKQVEVETINTGFFGLYRYATAWDVFLLVICSIMAAAGGAVVPVMTIVFGSLAGEFQGFSIDSSSLAGHIQDLLYTIHHFRQELSRLTTYFVYLAIGEFATIYICTLGFIFIGDRITRRIRERYLEAILRQNIGFFDKLGSGEVTTRITVDTNLIQDAISQKVANTITLLSTFVTAFIIIFERFWKLGFISLSAVVAMALVMGGMSKFVVSYSKRSLESFALSNTIAEESIEYVRTTVAFGAQGKLAKQYNNHLSTVHRTGITAKTLLGVSIAGMSCIVMLNYGLNFWMGSRFLVNDEVTVNKIVTITYATIIGAFSLGFLAPNMQAFTAGVAAAGKVFSTIDRQSPLDSFSGDGEILVDGTWKSDIDFQQVDLVYPSRQDVTVLDKFTLHVPAGKTTALVGASGSGKSSIVNLLERFYQPVTGDILLGGHSIAKLNLRFLRQQMALVGQEPVLFDTTIEANILYGLIGSKFENESDVIKRERLITAAKSANAHAFVSLLPDGYQTEVGGGGHLLSGGQKQRIAIARAIISDPSILLLDEATSALDTKSETIVQEALNNAAKGRTTIVIAHRLSTIKDADNIVVMDSGKIIEQGKHDELLQSKGAYEKLVNAQKFLEEKTEEGDIEDDIVLKKEMSSHALEHEVETTATIESVFTSANISRQGTVVKQNPLGKLISLIFSFNRKDISWMIFGLQMSILAGSGTPTSAVFFAKCIQSLSKPPRLYDQLRHDINFWCLMYLWLGILLFTVNFWRDRAFAICSERLMHRVRDKAFRSILRQDLDFFEHNSTGALISFLSTETTHLSGISGPTLGALLTFSTTLIAAIVLSIAFSWRLGLVCASTVPVLLGCGYLRFHMLSQFEAKAQEAYERSASYACEATSAIRTVASLTREKTILEEYHRQLDDQALKRRTSVLYSSALYAASQSFPFLCIALGFWYGGTLVSQQQLNIFEFFVCFTEITFGAQTAGIVFASAPDIAKGRSAANGLKVLFDRQPRIDTWATGGQPLEKLEGRIDFQNVTFRYPTRTQPVLRDLNLTIEPGKYVALVGASGCGKSTTVALLERFYDPTLGAILVDGQDISKLNVNTYRSHISLVSQEPTLYHGTIKENILLGASEDTSEDRLIQACRDANVLDFITSLPDSFSTLVGPKGVLLSGGQKQRLAIARALIRNPRILLLDEATSALDPTSESHVQAALDAASKGRTTIAIAHRLSTIQRADWIYVLEDGKVVEEGRHVDLVRKRAGVYREMVRLQGMEGGGQE